MNAAAKNVIGWAYASETGYSPDTPRSLKGVQDLVSGGYATTYVGRDGKLYVNLTTKGFNWIRDRNKRDAHESRIHGGHR